MRKNYPKRVKTCKTTQNKPKRPKARPKLTQNKLKQPKTTQNYPKLPKTSQNDSKGDLN